VCGFQAPGCAQEYWTTPADKTVPLPSKLTFEQGALVEPVAVAVHAISRAGQITGKRVAVLGAGPIGNLVAQVARSAGARVVVADVSSYRLAVGSQCGADGVSNPAQETLAQASARVFGGGGFDFAFECAGVESAMQSAIEAIRKGGTIILVGVFGEKPRVDLGLVQDRELNIAGTLMYRKKDYQHAVELIASGDIVTDPLVSRHFPFSDYSDAYHFIDAEGSNSMKVFIKLVSEP